MGTNKEPPMPFGRPIAAATVLCCQCGHDCAHKDAGNAMAQRLAAVEAEDRERAAMWGLDA